ncbi:MAG: CCA tRNA nucleotidyltransferase [Acidobacteriota bacterium]
MSLLQQIEPSRLSGALQIVKALRERGFKAYFAGGAVRDLLLGRSVADIDIATSAHPDDVEGLFSRTILVGKEFGVVIVVLDSLNYEVTTFRKESSYIDGRHPSEVGFTNAREDARRRDFTVNALFLDPFSEEVVDYVGGREDLEHKLIRTVGEPAQRFEEDKLRILRALRFACQLGFELDEETFEYVRRYAGQLLRVSWERIRDELLKMLASPGPARALDLLSDSGLLTVVLPEVEAMKGVEQPPEFHPEGDVFKHTRLMLELSGGNLDESLALGILLHDVGKPPTFAVKERIRFDGHAEVGAEMAGAICRRLRLPNDQTEEVVELVKHHLRFIHVQEMRESTLKRFLRMENFDKHLELHRLDCLSSHRDLRAYNFCREKLEQLSQEAIRPDPLIDGYDLIDLGFKPGPVFSEILRAVEDLQLEGKVASRPEALDWVRRNYSG